MKTLTSISLFVVVGLAAVASAATPRVPATPAPVDDLVYACPFTLHEAYQYDWRNERPLVTSGDLLVLKVAPNLVFPRQTAQPVLFVGDQTAERINVGYTSGYVVAIVPGVTDLAQAPIWFGTPQLPESVNANIIQAERSRANAAGITAQGDLKVQSALKQCGQKLDLANKTALLREAALLIQRYAPDEAELAETYLRN